MALSGSVSTSKYDGRYLKLSWTATQSVANNTSTIKWTLSAVGGNSSWYKTGPVSCSIDGDVVYSLTAAKRYAMYAGTIATGSKTITHKSDGTRTFKVVIDAAIYTTSPNCTGTKTFTLTAIDRVPNAPTSITVSAGNGSYIAPGDTATIKWSGASGNITGYQWQYQFYIGGTWEDWSATKTVTTTSGSGSATQSVTSTRFMAGDQIRFRVRAVNGSLYSSWITSSGLTSTGGIRIKVNGAWKLGTVYIKVNGAWKRATHVYAKASGAWKESM